MRLHPIVLLYSLSSLTLAPSFAQVGELDTDFSGDGRLTHAPVGDLAEAFAGSADALGRLVAVGSSREGSGNDTNTDFLILRVLANGTIDPAFGNAGVRRVGIDLEGGFDDFADSVWLRPDGRILVHGLAQNDPLSAAYRTPALVQLTADGDLDTSFSGDGKLALFYPDQGYTGGSSSTRLLPASGDAVWVTGICYQCTADGRLRLALARVLGNGTLDTSFGVNGWRLVEPPAPIAPGPWFFADWARSADGRLWAAVGNDVGVSGLLRLTAQGSPDSSWGAGGWKVTDHGSQGSPGEDDFFSSFALDERGRPVLGWSIDYGWPDQYVRLYRFTPAGALDATFGTAGAVTLDLGGEVWLHGLVPQGRGLLVVGDTVTDFGTGAHDFFAARYQENGEIDPEFGGNGMTLVAFDIPGVPSHDFARDLVLVGGRPILVGTAWEHALDLAEAPEGTLNGTRWAFARLQESWIFSDSFDQGGALGWSIVSP
jgi:uncharacterized delta-60 repeat protein